ncbi:MAG: response regulator, partial [Betaproteobacteria bacterium]|nr:response regulator [Betaproteobacteria bacterium]
DDDTFREVLGRALKRRGHVVIATASGAEALSVAKQSRLDAAVVDLRMPEQSGLDLITALHAAQPGVRILMLTGFASIATAVDAMKRGATHYLPKPADADEVLAALFDGSVIDTATVPAHPLSVTRLEWEHIHEVLQHHDGNISATARALKMHRRTLQRKLAKRPVAR